MNTYTNNKINNKFKTKINSKKSIKYKKRNSNKDKQDKQDKQELSRQIVIEPTTRNINHKLQHPDIDLVTNALEYFDKNNENNHNLFKSINYCKFVDADRDLEYNKIIFYDKDKKEIFISRYENIGIYESNTQLWQWAWSIPTLKNNSTNIVRKILKYGTELDINSLFVKNELITSKFNLNDPLQLEIVLSLSAYLSKKHLIYGIKLFENKIIDSDNIINISEPYVEGDEIKYIKNYIYLLD